MIGNLGNTGNCDFNVLLGLVRREVAQPVRVQFRASDLVARDVSAFFAAHIWERYPVRFGHLSILVSILNEATRLELRPPRIRNKPVSDVEGSELLIA